MTEAEAMFTVRAQAAIAEERMGDAILRAIGRDPNDTSTWPCDDFTFDDHDMSCEMKQTKPAFSPTLDHRAAIWALGFQKMYVCYTDGRELVYYAPR
jgi:hypothetical protein